MNEWSELVSELDNIDKIWDLNNIPFEDDYEGIYDYSSDVSDNEDDEYDSEDDDTNGRTSLGSWTKIKKANITFGVDVVDKLMLQQGRVEIPAVLYRLRNRMANEMRDIAPNVKYNDILPYYFFKLFFTAISSMMQHWLQVALKRVVDENEILLFIQAEIYIHLYYTSPQKYFEDKRKRLYPSACLGITEEKYKQFLRALSTSCHMNLNTKEDEWRAIFSVEEDMQKLVARFGERCIDLCFDKGSTWITVDDDHMRSRSRKATKLGYILTKNPKKGMGNVHHCIITVLTGFYLVGHIPVVGETTGDSVGIMLQALSKASRERLIDLKGTTIFSDRGYGGINGEISDMIIKSNANLIGTSKRCKKYPFTYGQKSDATRLNIEEKGWAHSQWAKQSLYGGKPAKTYYAMGFRAGYNRVVLMETTRCDIAGPGNYSLVTDLTLNSNPEETDPLFVYFEKNKVKVLTMHQRSAEWFLMRMFRITGTGAYALWRDSHYQSVDTNDIKYLIGIPQSTIEPATLSSNDINAMLINELRKKVFKRLLDTSGNKEELKQKLIKSTAPDNSKVIMRNLLTTWFMKSQKNTDEGHATKIGLANESSIAKHLGAFLKKYSIYEFQRIKEYGLLQDRRVNSIAFSPDGIMKFKYINSNNEETTNLALLEFKTKTCSETEEKEQKIADEKGKFVELIIKMRTLESNAIYFQELVPEVSYRTQLIHGMSSGKLEDCFYVVASTTKIIRVVHIILEYSIIESYTEGMVDQLINANMGWIHRNVEKVPEMDPIFFVSGLENAVDQATIEQQYALWRAANKYIDDTGQALPQGKFLMPTLTSLWNRCKGPIDIYSRYLANTKCNHRGLTPTGAIFIRFIMTFLYNAYKGYSKAQTVDFLISETCISFKQYTSHVNDSVGSFSDFLLIIAETINYTCNVSIPDTDVIMAIHEKVKYRKIDFFSQITLPITLDVPAII